MIAGSVSDCGTITGMGAHPVDSEPLGSDHPVLIWEMVINHDYGSFAIHADEQKRQEGLIAVGDEWIVARPDVLSIHTRNGAMPRLRIEVYREPPIVDQVVAPWEDQRTLTIDLWRGLFSVSLNTNGLAVRHQYLPTGAGRYSGVLRVAYRTEAQEAYDAILETYDEEETEAAIERINGLELYYLQLWPLLTP